MVMPDPCKLLHQFQDLTYHRRNKSQDVGSSNSIQSGFMARDLAMAITLLLTAGKACPD